MQSLLLQIIAGIVGLWLASRFVPGVEFTGPIYILFLAGLGLGLLNFFIKPIIKFITTPLRILTFGLFTLIINMAMVWIIDVFFPEIIITGIVSLFWTTIIVWGLGRIFSLFK